MAENLSDIPHLRKIVGFLLLFSVILFTVLIVAVKKTQDEAYDRVEKVTRELLDILKNEREQLHYFDKPTEISPRIVSNGIFIVETSQMLEREGEGRKAGDLEDTVVLLEITDPKNLEKWLENLKTQRKSPKDLHILLYSQEIDFKKLRELAKKDRNSMRAIRANSDFRAATEALNRGKEYVIFVKDSDYAGADFGDFYFLGKSILEIDENIEGICGGNVRNFSINSEMGDVFWLTDMICPTGIMYPRRKYEPEFRIDLTVMMRPEVPRVADSAAKVTDATWNVDFYSPSLLKIDEFERRLEYDLGNAERIEMNDWEELEERKFDKNVIYMLEYSSLDNLHFSKFNQDTIHTLPAYKGIIPKFSGETKMYFVPSSTFQTRFIDHRE